MVFTGALNGEAMLKLTGDEQEKLRARMVAHGLERDVLPLKPTVVTIMFGTNDAHDGEQALELHLKSLAQIIARLRDANCRVILLSAPPEEIGSAFNAEHEKFAAAVRALSERSNVPFVDVFHPVLRLVQQARRTDPNFSYTSHGLK
jgi:lysophospholipase L1-like esterase